MSGGCVSTCQVLTALSKSWTSFSPHLVSLVYYSDIPCAFYLFYFILVVVVVVFVVWFVFSLSLGGELDGHRTFAEVIARKGLTDTVHSRRMIA